MSELKTLKSIDLSAPSALDLQRFIPLPEVSAFTTLSDDTIKREHGDKIERLSARRVGMRLGNMLAIGKPKR